MLAIALFERCNPDTFHISRGSNSLLRLPILQHVLPDQAARDKTRLKECSCARSGHIDIQSTMIESSSWVLFGLTLPFLDPEEDLGEILAWHVVHQGTILSLGQDELPC